jgi:multidrug efflux pump subunit AcrB
LAKPIAPRSPRIEFALDRPYTFVVLALLVLIMSAVAISTTPTDIFPDINIPVVAVDWTYTGLNPTAGISA